MCGENIGTQISQQVEDALAEDVSYRLRQITNVRRKFIKNGGKLWHLSYDDYNTELCYF